MRHKKKSRLAAAEFLAVLIVTAVVFTKGLSAALAWRGYKAVGGEFMLLLLPIIYYEAKRIIRLRPASTTSETRRSCASPSSTSARELCRLCEAFSNLFSCIEKNPYGNLHFPRAIIEA